MWDVKSWLNQSVTMCVCVCACATCSIVYFGSGKTDWLPCPLSLGDWIWDCQWLVDEHQLCECVFTQHRAAGYCGNQLILADDNAGDCEDQAGNYLRERVAFHLAAALGHNSAVLLCWWSMSILKRVHCDESCILYLLCRNLSRFLVLFSLFLTHTPVQRPLSGTTQVSRYQKGRTNLDFTAARNSEWQWHQLGHMQACTSLQTDNHASTPPLVVSYFAEIFRPHHMHRMQRSDLFIHM